MNTIQVPFPQADPSVCRDCSRSVDVFKLAQPIGADLDFDATALIEDNGDVLTGDDVIAILSTKYRCDRKAVCRKAHARASALSEAKRLEAAGVKVVDARSLSGNHHGCPGTCEHPGLVAVVKPQSWGGGADVVYYCDDESHSTQPTPKEIDATEAYLDRIATIRAMRERIVEFAKDIFSMYPADIHEKLRRWTYGAFETSCNCDDAHYWADVETPCSKALDQFVLMHTIPACIPGLPERVLKPDYEVWPRDEDEIHGFMKFVSDVLASAGYDLSDEERVLMDYLYGLF